MRALITTAKMKNGGSRLVHNKSITHMSDTNICTCLLDSILVILPPSKNKELVGSAIASSMSADGNTSIIDISKMAFAKLYPKAEFMLWQITYVPEGVSCMIK